MNKLAVAAAVALAALGWGGAAQAGPLTVVGPECGPDPNVSLCSNAGPWPQAPEDAPFNAGPQGQMSMGTDEAPPAFPNNIPTGTKGYGGNYLRDASQGPFNLTFTMLGHGDAGFNNEFRVYDTQAHLIANGTAGLCIDWFTGSTPIGTTKVCSILDQLVPFEYIADSGGQAIKVENNGGANGQPRTPPNNTIPYIPAQGQGPSTPNFGLFDVNQSLFNQGHAFWIGLSDGGEGNNGRDSDMQDMVIRVVPEPGSLALLGLGLAGLAGARRRKS